MNDSIPHFYLTTAGEYEPLAEPRPCWTLGRLRDSVRDDYMIVRIAPPLTGQLFGLGGNDISVLLLSSRHEGFTLFPINEWPSYVYVARIVDEEVLKSSSFTSEQVQYIAKGTLYSSFNDAKL